MAKTEDVPPLIKVRRFQVWGDHTCICVWFTAPSWTHDNNHSCVLIGQKEEGIKGTYKLPLLGRLSSFWKRRRERERSMSQVTTVQVSEQSSRADRPAGVTVTQHWELSSETFVNRRAVWKCWYDVQWSIPPRISWYPISLSSALFILMLFYLSFTNKQCGKGFFRAPELQPPQAATRG